MATTFNRKYLTSEQLKMEYEAMSTEQKDVCIAKGMGFKLSISGSGYYEKIK